MEKIQILQEIFGKSFQVGKERLFFCPICKHYKPKLSINLDKNVYKCWICGPSLSGENIYFLIKKFGNIKQQNSWKELTGSKDLSLFNDFFIDKKNDLKIETVSLPKEFVSLTSSERRSLIRPLSYLRRRGLSTADIFKWRLGYCFSGFYEDRIIFPSFDKNGDLNYFVSRSISNSIRNKYLLCGRNKKEIIFNELDIDFQNDVYLVEGVFDAIKVGQNSIPLLGTELNEESLLFQKLVWHDSKVFLSLDPGEELKEEKIAKKFKEYGLELSIIPKDKSRDIGEMTREDFELLKKYSKVNNFQSLVESKLERI